MSLKTKWYATPGEDESSVRIPVTVLVEVSGHEQAVFLFSQNISDSGMFLESEESVPDDILNEGDSVDILFYLPSNASGMVSAECEIVRKQDLTGIDGKAVNGFGVEFKELDPEDKKKLHDLIKSYQSQLESDFFSEADEDVEVDEFLESSLPHQEDTLSSFFPHGLDFYQDCSEQILLEEDSPDFVMGGLHALIKEALDTLPKKEHAKLVQCLKLNELDIEEKLFRSLLVLKIKLIVEHEILKILLGTADSLSKNDREQLNSYFAGIAFEVDQCAEASYLLTQKLSIQERFEDFRFLNYLRVNVDGLVTDLETTLSNYKIGRRIFAPAEEGAGEGIIKRKNIDDYVAEVRDLIPDFDEESSRFSEEVSAEQIKEVWDAIFSLEDPEIEALMLRAYALRSKVQDELNSCKEIDEDIVLHRTEIIGVYRENARSVRTIVDNLRRIESDAADPEILKTLINWLENVTFNFGQLVKTIPKKVFTEEEIENVRYRTRRSRKKKRRGGPQISPFQRKRIVAGMAAMLLCIFSVNEFIKWNKSAIKPLALRYVGSLPIHESYRRGRSLALVIDSADWKNLSFNEKQQHIKALQQKTRNEDANDFQMYDKDGSLIAIRLYSEDKIRLDTFFLFQEVR